MMRRRDDGSSVRQGPETPLYALRRGLCRKMRARGVSDEAPTEAVLTAEQAAQLLKVSTKTVLRLARGGDLPAHKVGRSWRFSRAALLGWLDRGGVDGERRR